jgi:hypothetical protein
MANFEQQLLEYLAAQLKKAEGYAEVMQFDYDVEMIDADTLQAKMPREGINNWY